MLNIKSEDTVELIDANHDQIEETFQNVRVEILPQVSPLGTSTGIGNNFKNQALSKGISWDNLK